MKPTIISRRQLLQLSGMGFSTLTLAGCVGATQPVPLNNALASTVTNVPTATSAPLPIAAELQPMPTATDVVALFNGIPHGITAEGFPYLGNPDAPITMIDYSDFL